MKSFPNIGKKVSKNVRPEGRMTMAVILPEGVGLLVPAQLSPDAVSNGGDKLPTQTQLRAQLQGKLLWGVLLL